RVTRSKIGVGIQPVSAADAQAFGLDRPRGSLVNSVEDAGPADKAGIRPGDIILSVDGRPVESNSSLPAMISTKTPGSPVELELWRDGKQRKVSARVVEMTEEGVIARRSPGGPSGGPAPAPEQGTMGL